MFERLSSKLTGYATTEKRLIALGVALVGFIVLFMTFNHRGSWEFVLQLRGEKILLLLLASYAVGTSTLLFQTLTNNPILTPGILGFDALYILLQTVLIFTLGSIEFSSINPYLRFGAENAVMIGASFLLFGVLTKYGYKDLTRMILIGVVFATLFRSLNGWLQRMLDPSLFVLLQTRQFAQFNTVDPALLLIGVLVMVASVIWVWNRRFELDVLLLGRDKAVALGVDYNALSRQILIVVAILVATSTTLVGPVGFFGLLVCALANAASTKMTHALRFPMVWLVSAITLVGGQFVFEQLLGMRSVLSVVIEFAGGCVFLWLIFRRQKHQQSESF